MITSFLFECDLADNLKTSNLSSLFHGVLMEELPNNIVESLHRGNFYNPLKQRLYPEDDVWIWEIVSFHEEISSYLSNHFIKKEKIHLKHHHKDVPIYFLESEKINIRQLMRQYFEREETLKRYLKISIKTPVSFKTSGRYDVMPDVSRIFRSIMVQFDGFFKDYKMHDHEALSYISDYVHIVDYRIRTTRFHLEKVGIRSFVGDVTFQINGPQQLRRLVHFLLTVGTYTGIGVKTTLGMGKFKIN